MLSYCIICYKRLGVPNPPKGNEKDVSSKSREKCEMFFKLLERYLKEPGEKCFQPFPVLENIFDVGIPISCVACQGVMESFCELFHQMKSIELLINWKLWTLKNVMHSAERAPSRLKNFKKGIMQMKDGKGSSDEELNLILNFKRDLIGNCQRKLLTTFPRLELVKFHQVKIDESVQFSAADESEAHSSHTVEEQIHFNDFVPESLDMCAVIEIEIDGRSSSPPTDDLITAGGQDLNDGPEAMDDAATENINLEQNTHQQSEAPPVIPSTAPTVFSSASRRNSITEGDSHDPAIILTTKNVQSKAAPNNFSKSKVVPTTTDFSPATNTKKTEKLSKRSLRSVYRCVTCMKTFSTAGRLLEHQQLHESEKCSDSKSDGDRDRSSEMDNSESDSSSTAIDDAEDDIDSEEDDNLIATNRRPLSASPCGSLFNDPESDDSEAEYYNDDHETKVVKEDFNLEEYKKELELKSQLEFTSTLEPNSETATVDNIAIGTRLPDDLAECNEHPQFTENAESPSGDTGVQNSSDPTQPNPITTDGHTCAICKSNVHREKVSQHYNTFHNLNNMTDSDVKKCEQTGCAAYFLTYVQLRMHEKKVHGIERKFTCSDCNITYKDSNALRKHDRKKHANELKYVCTFENCDSRFKTSELLEGHTRAIHGQKRQLIKCPKCEKRCWGEFNLKNHLKTHSSSNLTTSKIRPQVFKCKIRNCAKRLATVKDYEYHQKLHGRFTCFFCDVTKDYAVRLAKHEIREHSQFTENVQSSDGKGLKDGSELFSCPRPNCSFGSKIEKEFIHHFLADHMKLKQIARIRPTEPCPVCKSTLQRNQMKAHYNSHHNLKNLTGSDVNKCVQTGCGAYFLTSMQLRLHEKNRHAIEKRYTCTDCNISFKTSSKLRRHHHQKHKNELNHVCPVENCFKRYKTSELLDSHTERIHGRNVQLVYCPTCEKPIWGKGSLKEHLKSHLTIQKQKEPTNYICELCGKTVKGKLTDHMRTHTKEKQFVCEVCGESYARRDSLRLHVKIKHGKVTGPQGSTKRRKGIKRKVVEDDEMVSE